MKKFLALTILIVVAACNSGHSQGREQAGNKPANVSKAFLKLANELNGLTDTYAGLYPMEVQRVLLSDYRLTYKDFPADTEEHNYSESFSADKDSIDVFSLQEFYQGKIQKKIVELTGHKDFGKADIKKLVSMSLTKSADGKLYNFVYDENTGGSYRSRTSYVYYTGFKGEQNQEVYNNDGYDTIIPLKSKGTQRYLMLGSVAGCGTCFVQYAKVLHYDQNKAVVDFQYSLDTRIGYENSLTYNAADEILTADYFTDDLQSFCLCTEEDKNNPVSTTDSNGLPTRHCGCTFAFNGETFVLKNRVDEEAKQ